MKTIIVPILFLIVLFTACRSEQFPNATPLPSVVITDTATHVKLLQTATRRPAQTATSTSTWTPTYEPTNAVSVETLSAISTKDSLRLKIIEKLPELQGYYQVQMSPNGRRILFSNGNTIELFKDDGARIGKYSFYDLYGFLIDYYGGYVSAVHWAKDGRYLYISTNPGGDGGPEPYFHYQSSLARVNLETGTWRDVDVSGSFEFSTNDRFVIYSDTKSQLWIRDIQNSSEQIYSSPEYYLYFGNYVWSNDSKKVIFVGTPEDWYANASKFALFMIDIENATISQLYEMPLPFYYPIEWSGADTVVLNKFNDFGEWELDLTVNPPAIKP